MSKILVAIPIKPSLNPVLLEKCVTLAGKLPAANPTHTFTTMLDFTPIAKTPQDFTPWSKVYKARNLLLSKVNLKDYDYVFWPDADIIDYPLNIVSRLIEVNPEGMSAPLVLIEDTKTFYDYTAFVELGKSHIEPHCRNRRDGRNLNPFPPYWSTGEPQQTLVEMDCVGAINLVPAWVYEHTRYTDNPAFTDHFPLAKVVREHGKKVICDRSLVAYHANLPKYGHNWN